MTHAHHWRIETPDGRAELPGECIHCGAVEMFRAAPPDDAQELAFHSDIKRKRRRPRSGQIHLSPSRGAYLRGEA